MSRNVLPRRTTCLYISGNTPIDASLPPQPPPVYPLAGGDIHGEASLLRQLLAMLPVRSEDTVVFLGDYLDQGEDSAATIAVLREFAHDTVDTAIRLPDRTIFQARRNA
jgi:hypothetical protein